MNAVIFPVIVLQDLDVLNEKITREHPVNLISDLGGQKKREADIR